MYRQGDVLLIKVDALPLDQMWNRQKQTVQEIAYHRSPVKGNILAEGEVTGHHHVAEGNVSVFTIDWGRQMFAIAKEAAVITHPEHASIAIEPGIYQVVRQREYDGTGVRNVRD